MVSSVGHQCSIQVRIDHLYQDPHEKNRLLILHYGDLTDASNLIRIIQQVQPDEIYNLAAQSHVQVSFESPEYTANTDGLGTFAFWRASASWAWKVKPDFTKPQPQSFMERFRRCRKPNPPLSIPAHLTPAQNFMLTGSRLITVKPIISMHATGCYSIMSPPSVEKPL